MTWPRRIDVCASGSARWKAGKRAHPTAAADHRGGQARSARRIAAGCGPHQLTPGSRGPGRPRPCAVLSPRPDDRHRDPGQAETDLAAGMLTCPSCTGPLQPWGHARSRTVRDHGTSVVALCPRRARCRTCRGTHALLPAVVGPRRADTTAVTGVARHRRRRQPARRLPELQRRAGDVEHRRRDLKQRRDAFTAQRQ
jgi:hypothetical protein